MAVSFSSYEQRRLKNIEENKKVLRGLGLLNGGLLPKRSADSANGGGHQRKQGIKRKRSFRHETEGVSKPSPGFDGCYTRRWSRRLEGKEPQDYGNLDLDLEEEDEDTPTIKRPIRISENVFGAIPGIPVGTTWASRLDCSRDGVHRPTVAGIHGNEALGCYSIALSGGYEDDLDFGLAFTYTGAGGRDLKGTKANPKNLRTAPQSKDQTLERSNLALSRNVENRLPVRVIRGYKLDSPYAPEEGYRYDGLYTVERFWQAIGLSGFMVYKFALKRCEDQGPCPWKLDVDDLMNGSSEEIRNGDGDECSTESSDGKNGESSEDRPEEAQGVSKEFEIEETSGIQESGQCATPSSERDEHSAGSSNGKDGESSEDRPAEAQGMSKECKIEETSGIQENGQCATPSLEGDEHSAGSSNGKDGESSEDRPAEVHGVSKEFEIKETSEIQENGKGATPSSEGGEHSTENGEGKNGESSEKRT